MSRYERVLPRDLFNEAKLLKCLGFVTLAIHNNQIRGIQFEADNVFNFEVSLSTGGYIFVCNISFRMRDETPVYFTSPYNSQRNFPLHYEIGEGEECLVFNEDGTFTEDFLEAFEN